MICHNKNYDNYHKGREGGGQRVMIEIIISENDDNDGRPLTLLWKIMMTLLAVFSAITSPLMGKTSFSLR